MSGAPVCLLLGTLADEARMADESRPSVLASLWILRL
jgi:hypothetical protein